MPSLSVAMIVKNEAHCLAECLDSVQGIADELVIGDTGSTDDTVAIAERFGARVLRVPWRDDFAAARNEVLAHATGDWLLHLDADEMLDPEGARRIRALVDADGAGADAIEVTLANYCDDPRAWRWTTVAPGDPFARGHAGCIKVGLLRLFRNGMGFSYREPVHESITESVRECEGVVRTEPIVVHHYGYQPATAMGVDKMSRYLAIARRKVEERREDAKAWHDLAELEFAAGHVPEAETASRRALAIEPHHLGAATTLVNILLNRGDFKEARTLLEGLEAAGITAPHVQTALGAIDCREGNVQRARVRLEGVLEAAPEAVMARVCLARALDHLGDTRGARTQLEQASAIVPDIKEFRDLVEAHESRTEGERAYMRGDTKGALEALVQALRLDPEDPFTHNALGVVLAALGEAERARVSFDRALQLAPHMPEVSENLAALG